jgi:hypothetical protein
MTTTNNNSNKQMGIKAILPVEVRQEHRFRR